MALSDTLSELTDDLAHHAADIFQYLHPPYDYSDRRLEVEGLFQGVESLRKLATAVRVKLDVVPSPASVRFSYSDNGSRRFDALIDTFTKNNGGTRTDTGYCLESGVREVFAEFPALSLEKLRSLTEPGLAVEVI